MEMNARLRSGEINSGVTPAANQPGARFTRVLDPMDRISEILFGLIMVLTYTSTLGIVTGDRAPVREMLIAALGCNLAWGIIDAGLYLLDRLNEQGRSLLTFRAIRAARDREAAMEIIDDVLPASLAGTLQAEHVDAIRERLRQAPEPRGRPRLTREDWIGALGVCLLVFFCTFPVVIPFIFMSDAELALRISNTIAIGMLFLCGYAFGQASGVRPWGMGLSMVAFGVVLVGVAIALGG
jgi:hypothetical protein